MQPPLTGSEIRQSFIDYFKEKGHTFVQSASLVPGGDQTLLFTNAGMVQFKDVFLGIDKRPYSRAVNSQKCMRVAGKHNDLEDVGRDDTHHTFFEMLGNWSFGDYYKNEAISWAWELLTEIWKLDKNRLWVTCFQDEKGEIPTDEEAAAVWGSQPGLIKSHIIYLGRKENFWEMAETGPCGPCSEIYIDQGEGYCKQRNEPDHVCDIEHNCRRFLEFWNLVFIQYNRLSPSELIALPSKHVDTGMGLDRITSILQNVKSNYSTDLLLPLINEVMNLAHQIESEKEANPTPYRVIADHSRAAAFLIADGVVPGNIGRNYITRMIIRRASRFGGKIGLNQPFLAKIAEKVIENYGDAFPELKKNKTTILDNITREEKRFHATIETGLAHLQDELNSLIKSKQKTLKGKAAFDLYATHGLPFEIARDVAREQGLDIEESGFKQSMEEHRTSSGAGKAFGAMGGEKSEIYANLLKKLIGEGKLPEHEIKYEPYSNTSIKSQIVSILTEGEEINQAGPGDNVEIVLPETCFYIESGGQVSDAGLICSQIKDAWEIRINEVIKPAAGMILHIGEVIKGNPKIGDKVIVEVDAKRRRDIMRNHTATHLLHAELRKVIGEHVRQAGSLVAPDHLRFDFTQNEPISEEVLEKVEEGVNQSILSNYPVTLEVKPLAKATDEGAMALFGEKYGESVRTISIMGESRISYELCGGTHVNQTGDIGSFIILNESSVAAGIRRIEAITGVKAYEVIRQRMKNLRQISSKLSIPMENSFDRVNNLITENEKKIKEIGKLQEELASIEFENNKNKDLQKKDQTTVYITTIGSIETESLRKLADKFRIQNPSSVLAIGTKEINSERVTLLISITEDLVKNKGLNAVEMVKEAGVLIGGGGGGKPTLAQAGGNNSSNLPLALNKIRELVNSKI
jgi:alanyl-tRNA synthetase